MIEIIKSLITGIILWGVFVFLRLPLPAPTAFAWVVWIIGVYLGYVLISKFM